MARENVETVREFLHAFEGGGVDAVAEYWHPEIDWRAIEGAIDDVGEMHGVAAVRRYVQEWVDMFDDLENVPIRLQAAGADRVVAEQRLKGRAKLSGAETELRYAVVYTIRDGKIARGREYATFDEALQAAEPDR